MATSLDKVLYTAKTHVTGGRDGNGRSDDGKIEVRLSPPAQECSPRGLAGPSTRRVARSLRTDLGPQADLQGSTSYWR